MVFIILVIIGLWLIFVDYNILVLYVLFLFLLLENILKLRKEGVLWNWELEVRCLVLLLYYRVNKYLLYFNLSYFFC